jgi:hypothetical protein
MTTMNYIGLDVHKKTISYCVKDVSGRIQQEGKIGSTRRELDCGMKTLPQPWTVAMEATILLLPVLSARLALSLSVTKVRYTFFLLSPFHAGVFLVLRLEFFGPSLSAETPL